MLILKRIYDEPAASDGYRVLVDRLWPRGITKQAAAYDMWLKAIAPSPELRRWFGHDPARFDEFRARYRTELENNDTVIVLRELIATHPVVTLLYAAADPVVNHAAVLREYMTDGNA